MNAVALVAAINTPDAAMEIHQVPNAVSWLQIRADLIGDIPADWLRSRFPGKLLYTLRSCAAGGAFDRSHAERKRRLAAAASDYDLVELEAETDFGAELLDAIPPARRMIAWRGKECEASRIHDRFLDIAAVPARYYCIITTAGKASDGVQPLLLLKRLKRTDVIAFCDGAAGAWSQLLAPHFGAPLMFSSLDPSRQQMGELNAHQLIADYGLPTLRPVQEVYGMVGARIFKSPSPRLHNTAYRILNHPALFLPFHVEHFEDFWQKVVESGALDSLGTVIQGLVIVSPHKEAALTVAGASSSMVRRAGATNVFVRRGEVWEAETTDPETIASIKDICPVKAAVIGCGGAGRAVAAALQQTGSDVTLVNRGPRRGAHAVQLLGLPFIPLSEFRANGFNLIVNATPIGKENDEFPFVVDSLGNGTLVIDLAYGSHPTPLVSAVLARGGVAIDGYDVLLTQVRKQFHLMTGLEMPAGIGRETVLDGHASHFRSADSVMQATAEASTVYECNF
jgi:3-dehydroquinate dehydratase / shikimate dehydrogenase